MKRVLTAGKNKMVQKLDIDGGILNSIKLQIEASKKEHARLLGEIKDILFKKEVVERQTEKSLKEGAVELDKMQAEKESVAKGIAKKKRQELKLIEKCKKLEDNGLRLREEFEAAEKICKTSLGKLEEKLKNKKGELLLAEGEYKNVVADSDKVSKVIEKKKQEIVFAEKTLASILADIDNKKKEAASLSKKTKEKERAFAVIEKELEGIEKEKEDSVGIISAIRKNIEKWRREEAAAKKKAEKEKRSLLQLAERIKLVEIRENELKRQKAELGLI